MLKSERVYQAIKRRIVSYAYTSGYRLVVADLAQEFGVSALPVRDALARLEQEGMIETRRNVGALVVGIDPRRIRDELTTVAYLEGIAAGLALEGRTEADLMRAESINDAMAEAIEREELGKLAALNQSFHEALCLPCPNQRVEQLLKDEWNWSKVLMETAYEVLRDVASEGVRQHAALLELFRAGPDAREVELAVRTHRLGNLDVLDALERKDLSFRG